MHTLTLPKHPDHMTAGDVMRFAHKIAKQAHTDVVSEGGMHLKHGSQRDNLTLDDISIVRTGQKQGKKGRSYGGFYATDVADVEQARGYANMNGVNGSVYDVIVAHGTRILHKEGDITRLSARDIEQWVGEGYGMVVGKDPRGRTEYVVIDKAVIVALQPESC